LSDLGSGCQLESSGCCENFSIKIVGWQFTAAAVAAVW
jgi:hypothetical protein